MELRQVKGNTWVLDSWELIPLYKLDAHRCVLLDTGTWDQRDELETALDAAGLDPVAILCSHAHMDHMGSNVYFQKTRGTQVIMSLGEAAQIMSPLGIQLQYYNFNMGAFGQYPELGTAPCLPDRILLPGEREIEIGGAQFEILPTPGHTIDHISVRTPDDVLYLADAMMTGRILHHAKFPYAISVGEYLDTLVKLREVKAAEYIVAHKGIYQEILPFIDLELRFFRQRMLDLLDRIDEVTTPKLLTQAICAHDRARPKSPRSLAYFEQASQNYLNYLTDQGWLALEIQENALVYRKVSVPGDRPLVKLPPTGWFCDNRPVRRDDIWNWNK